MLLVIEELFSDTINSLEDISLPRLEDFVEIVWCSKLICISSLARVIRVLNFDSSSLKVLGDDSEHFC